MKKWNAMGLVVLSLCATSQAQYNGKYEGWSTGYIFTGSVSQIVWKAYTHLCNFQVTVSGSGGVNTGSLAVAHGTFVSTAHANNSKAIICIGGQGQSKNFTTACSNPATQTTLVKNIVNLVKQNGYDGVDMDWEIGEESDNAANTARFKAFHKELHDSLAKMTPRPLFLAAVATSWYPNCTAAIAEYVDQLNNMSYYDPVTKMDEIFKPVLDKGVPKTIQGVGFGFDSDGEISDVKDVSAKCRYAIDKGYGGIMIWDITHAPKATTDSIARYVTKNPATFLTSPMQRVRNGTLQVQVGKGGRLTGLREVSYTVPSAAKALFVNLGMYDMRGSLVKTLVSGYAAPGEHVLSVDAKGSNAIGPGNYVFKLSAGGSQAAQAVTLP